MKVQKSKRETKITYYEAGAVVVIGVLGVFGYYVYKSKTHKKSPVEQPKEALVHRPKETPDKFNMD